VSRPVGRLRIKLAAMLSSAGLLCDGEDIWIQEGVYRHVHWDLARWGAHCRGTVGRGLPETLGVNVHCWDTITECVRCGFTVGQEPRDGPTTFEVHAKRGEA
jgi:hypothetical protein